MGLIAARDASQNRESILLDAADFVEHYALIMEHAGTGLEISVEEKCQRTSAAAAKVHVSLTGYWYQLLEQVPGMHLRRKENWLD